ncbi:esterase-like activity of phytase family protein [Bradyrhizobium ontarionense]|uniref:Esterase-like activity of phytase family protein n=1 Tax=Bradyrhizobium ontarionense TaxID=2898149 RepID=A0ABY3R575_9BRAD|nr:esterase-like activity of phytase family protein [Bradyrhizobium sp. A19]UFZ02451.1 esterase-like activity of phytase family protein [Bradyrhizobium sp. A19]
MVPNANSGRRRFLALAIGGVSAFACSRTARAQLAPTPVRNRAATDEHSVTSAVRLEVRARPLPSFDLRDRSHVRFGRLEYRSGLALTSSYPGFGGLSGIRLDARGDRFLAISDKGGWFTGRIAYSGREMVGLADVEAAPLLGPDGRPITARGWYDSESIARDGDIVYVGLERVNQLLRYDFAKGGTGARSEIVPLPPAAKRLPNNKGLEALVFVPKGLPLAGTLIAMSERGLDANGNLLAFLIGGPSAGQFSIRRSNDFDVSDAVLLPSGDLLVLERKFSLFNGVGIRIRRLALAEIAPDALVDGPEIFAADLGQEIDNLEGIDAHVTPEGETVLTLVSDDNFSLIQRTLLLQFTLVN